MDAETDTGNDTGAGADRERPPSTQELWRARVRAQDEERHGVVYPPEPGSPADRAIDAIAGLEGRARSLFHADYREWLDAQQRLLDVLDTDVGEFTTHSEVSGEVLTRLLTAQARMAVWAMKEGPGEPLVNLRRLRMVVAQALLSGHLAPGPDNGVDLYADHARIAAQQRFLRMTAFLGFPPGEPIPA